MTAPRCQGHTYSRGSWPCGAAPIKGKNYCTAHDPERIKARESARRARIDQEYAEDEQRQNAALALCKRLGAGTPYFNHAFRGKSGYTGGVVLTQDEVTALLARLAWLIKETT